jgi:hypothetical protein
LLKKVLNRTFVTEIELRSIAREQIREIFRFKPPNERAPDHSAMAGDKDLIGFLQLHGSL